MRLMVCVLPLIVASVALGAAPSTHSRSKMGRTPLPPGAVLRLGNTRFAHESSVVVIAFSPSGKNLTTLSGNGIARWDVASGSGIRFLPARVGIYNCA